MDSAAIDDFAARYAAAWSSQDAASVSLFFEQTGSLTINGGVPSLGRSAIRDAAQSFMTAFPDLVVTFDGASADGDRTVFRWTLTGTNTGPGGTGRAVRISGHERWRFGASGLIADSLGYFDAADYQRQING